MGLSNEEYNALCSGSDKFFTISSYGFDDVKAVMQLVFGSDRSSDHALAWTSYWERVFPLAGQLDRDEPYTAPDVPPQFGSDDVTMTDAAPSGTPVLSISLDGQADRQEVKKLGKSFDTLVAALVIERSEKNSVGDLKPIYHCLGCDNSWRNNSRTRCGPHLIACSKLQRDFPDAWEAFRDSFSNASASNVLTGKAVAPPVREKSRKAEDPNHDRVAIPGIATASTKAAPVQRTLGASWGSTEKMTAPRQSAIDYLLLRLLVCCSLAFALLDNGFFIDFCNALCSSYSVPDRSSFVTSRLAIETTYAMEQLQAMVQSFIHLTLSFDGWSSRRKDEIYTTHVTTSACLSYLVAGIILTGISATGDKICEELTKYTAVRFSMVVSDTTGNVKKCRALICTKWPWILNCPDPCHQLNLLAKEIMVGSKEFPKIKGFTEPMKFVSLITTFFSHSNDSTIYLRDELKTEEDRRSLVAFGETRFSTFANQARSVSRYFNAIQSLFERGQVKFDTKAPTSLNEYHRQPTDPKRVRIPTLDDLLNPTAPTDSDAPIDLGSVFNLRSKDPFNTAEVEDMVDGEDETDIDAPPLVQRVANLPVLEIETYIGLKAPKLTQRFGPKQMDIRTALSPQKPKAAKAPWNAGSSKWDARKW
ncbi:hypothetical protein R3P38DRAFT_3459720 [Favolaschia claudopus]|uniref:DUF659 domain-containing protein n=1 Tax=Favolaschia claudopus TaxID=2862362 RepID=A0AAV9ZI29_9AGAR